MERNIEQSPAPEAMREEIKIMIEQIGPTAFKMMGAKKIVYSNARTMLQWQMGSGAKCDVVQLFYVAEHDLYTLRFVTYMPNREAIKDDKTLTMIQVEDLERFIEEQTGFYLSFGLHTS